MTENDEITELALTNRQAVLIPPERLKEYIPVVIGVGNVGHQVALMLAKMGAKNVILVDPDVIGPENVYPQGYALGSLGLHKVTACVDEMLGYIPDEHDIKTGPDKFNPATHLPDDTSNVVIFCCVDSMATRGEIFRDTIIDRGCPLFVDGRVGGETLQVFAVTPETYYEYAATLFPDSEANVAPCGARATIYTGTIAAGFMVHQFAAFLRGLKPISRMELTLCDHDISIPEF